MTAGWSCCSPAARFGRSRRTRRSQWSPGARGCKAGRVQRPAPVPALLLPFRDARDHRPGARHRPSPGSDLRRRAGRPAPRRVDRRQERDAGWRLGRRERGLRRPRPRRRGVGLRGQPRPDDRRSGPGRGPGRPDRPGIRDRDPPARRAGRSAARPVAGSRHRWRRIPSRCRWKTRSATCSRRTRPFGASTGIAFTDSMYGAQREWKTFAATDGSYTEQVITHVGSGIEANAVDGDELQRRSFPDAGGGWQGAGYEYVRSLGARRERRARRDRGRPAPVRTEAAAGTPDDRPPPVAARTSRSTRAAATRRSSTGSSGPRRATPGRSFLTTDKLDAGFRYGSELDRHRRRRHRAGRDGHVRVGRRGRRRPGGAARGGRAPHRLPEQPRDRRRGSAAPSGGAMRADGWNRIPLIRMTNINLLPKPGMSFDQIVADTDDGLLLAHNRSWSIDDRRLNFQFATELAWEIKGGKLGQLYRNATYTGITPEFWGSCDAVADASSYVMLGTPNCGKGEPLADRPRRARLLGRPVPQRPGRGDEVSAMEMRTGGTPAAAPRDRGDRPPPCRGGRARPRPRCWSTAEDAALTRFANSEIHQNVAEANVRVSLRFVRGKRVAVATTGPNRRGRPPPAGGDGRADQRPRGGDTRLDGPARTRPDPTSVGGAFADGTATASPELRAEGVRAVIAAADAAGVTAYGSFATTRGDRGRRELARDPGGRGADRQPAHHGLDGSGGRHRLRGGGRGGRHDHRRGARWAARPPRRPGDPRDPWRSSRATTRSCSPSTRSSTSWTCSGYLGFSALAVEEGRSFFEPGRRSRERSRHHSRRRQRPGRPARVIRLRGRRLRSR